MSNDSIGPHGATTVRGDVPTVPFVSEDFPRPEIQDTIAGAMAMVPLPSACTSQAWNEFGGALAAAMGDKPFAQVFMDDNPWAIGYDWLKRMQPEARSRFLRWFFSGVFPYVGLRIGEIFAQWMTKGIFPTTVDVEKMDPASRFTTVNVQIARFGQMIVGLVPEYAKAGEFLSGGPKILTTRKSVQLVHRAVGWTVANQAMDKLRRPIRGAWEHAWSVVRDLVEWIVSDEVVMFQQQLKLWHARQIISGSAIPADGGGTRFSQVIRDALQVGIDIGDMTASMKEHVCWVGNNNVGAIMASAVRDQAEFPNPLPNPAAHLLRVCEAGFWPLGVKGRIFFLCDMFAPQ